MVVKASPNSAWIAHRDTIKNLWINQGKTQDEVLQILRQPPYNLVATLFERIVADVLKLSKNLRGEDWLAIKYHTAKRKRERGEETVVIIDGKVQESKKLRREANRYRKHASTRGYSPRLPPRVVLMTPPSSPLQNSIEDVTFALTLPPTPSMIHAHAGPVIDATADTWFPMHGMTNLAATDVAIPAYDIDTEMQDIPGWSEFLGHPPSPGSGRLQSGRFPTIFMDRYEKLLKPSPWFDFRDWFYPKLSTLTRHQFGMTNMPLQSDSHGNTKLGITLRAVMGITDYQSAEFQKAKDFVLSVMPEQFTGEFAKTLGSLQSFQQAQFHTAQLILSLLANNHKSAREWENKSMIENWLLDLPIALLKLVVGRQDPTATAITAWMVDWSITYDIDKIFKRLVDAKLDGSYLTAERGGKLLLKALGRRLASDEIVMDILKHKPCLHVRDRDRRTPLHLAAQQPSCQPMVLQALIDQGANVNALDKEHNTPFMSAFDSGVSKNVEWFLDNSASVEQLGRKLRFECAPSFDVCKLLCDRYPNRWPTLTAHSLVFAAIGGLESLEARVEELTEQLIDDVEASLEEALCLTMKLMSDETSIPYEDHFVEVMYPADDKEDFDLDSNGGLIPSDVLDVFLQHSVNPNTPSAKSYTCPMTMAIRSWTIEDVERLLEHGASLDSKSVMHALEYEQDGDRFEMFRYILIQREAKLHVNRRLRDGRFPLQAICAIHRGREGQSLVEHLVNKGAQVNSRASRGSNYTTLHFAVQHGRLDTTRYLIARGARTRGWFNQPEASLFELCLDRCYECGWERGHEEDQMNDRLSIFKLLLETGAETDFDTGVRDFGRCLVNVFEYWRGTKLAEQVFQTKMQMYNTTMLDDTFTYVYIRGRTYTPIQLAAFGNEHNIVKNLIEMGADINEDAGSYRAGTVLQLSCGYGSPEGNLEFVQYLLDRGANVNAPGSEVGGKTALQQACSAYIFDLAVVELLLERGADVNGGPSATEGRTALQAACSRDEIDFKLIHLLLDHAADINAPAAPTKGITALQGAVISGNIELVLMLLERGARVDAEPALVSGRTALEAAAEHGKLFIFQILLNAYDATQSPPPLDEATRLAEGEGHYGIVELINRRLGKVSAG